jgi:hypothetical protein
MGEVKVGVIKLAVESASYLLTLPLIPSHQGRGNEFLDRLCCLFSCTEQPDKKPAKIAA